MIFPLIFFQIPADVYYNQQVDCLNFFIIRYCYLSKADSSLRTIRLISLVIQEGFEPPTHGLEERKSTTLLNLLCTHNYIL